MRSSPSVGPWVVYQATVRGQAEGPNVVCGQAEWDELERAQPGYHRLIQAGIAHEGEAERLARGKSGDPVPRSPKATRPVLPPA